VKKLFLVLVIALMSAGLVCGQVLTLDQTGVTGDGLKHGAGFVTGSVINTIKTVPPGSHFLITMRGNQNLNWGSIGAVTAGEGFGDDFKPISEITFPPSSRGGTWQARISASQLLNVPGAGAASSLFFNAWGNHVIQKVEFVVPKNYTPPAQLSVYSTQSGLGSGVKLSGGNITSDGIVVPVDKSWDENGQIEFIFEFSSPVDITKYERIVIEWDGVHPHVSSLFMQIGFYDNHAKGRYSIINPPFMLKNYSGGILGEQTADWDKNMTAWRTLNKKAITKIRFWMHQYTANKEWDNHLNLNTPGTENLVIKNIRFVAAEKF